MQKPLQTIAKTAELPSSPKRQAILVLGMHRSGTSALGGVVNALGAAGPKTLMSPHASNPRGLFESLPLVAAHDELLLSAGSYWLDWRRLDQERVHSKAAEPHRQKIKELLVDEFGDEPLIVIKDPRICRFVPFISSILAELNISPVAFLPVRNPLEVAYSLRRRDNIALPKSLLLWLGHVLEAEYHSRHMPRYFLPYEGLLIDWRNHMDRAAEKTGVVWPALSDRAGIKIEQFLTTDLYHERSTLEDMRNHPDVTSLVRETYEILTAIVDDGENKDLLDRLDLVRTKFNEGCETFGTAIITEELAVARLRGELSARDAETERVRQENSNLASFLEQRSMEVIGLAAERDALAGAHDALVAERDGLAQAHNNLRAERDALAQAHHNLSAERDALAQAHHNLSAERDALAQAHHNLSAERDAHAQAHHNLSAERDAHAQAHNHLINDRNNLAAAQDSLIAERDGLLREREALLASSSWRVTAPIRWIKTLSIR
ncbi:sulfotransferase family protein [Mesorhizobium sp. AR07]|uniref:sulfotransferase family protein n=1 Tax=Mesorhizobium sp. AR07 TaxID=2865838 RepID=UPI00215E8996|nr:sulfotransferase family protein [Mesorhizobium sp. AR07]UVK46863.1 sulfotransferase family protein [Mesorhizobium sp. AR07]